LENYSIECRLLKLAAVNIASNIKTIRMAYHPDYLRSIIRLGCQLIDHWSPEAKELLLGTATKESHLRALDFSDGVWQSPWCLADEA